MKKTKVASRANKSMKYFLSGCRCSEAILLSYGRDFGFGDNTAMKVGCALGGGLGSAGDLCGAVTSSIIILGLKYGRVRKDDAAKRKATDRRVKKFLREFQARHGALRCNDLIGFDRSSAAGHASAERSGVFETLCPKLVRDAALLLEKIAELRS